MASGHERYDWGAQIARRVWSSALTNRSLVRALITSVALTAGVLLLRHDRRTDRGNLFVGSRILLRRPARLPAAGLSVQDDGAEHGQASQQSEHAVLENDPGRLRSFRGDAAGADGRVIRK